MTKVYFKICMLVDNDVEEIPETVIEQNFEKYRGLLLQQDVIEGAIIIETQDNISLEIEDELWFAVTNLCFNSSIELLEAKKECFIYRYMNCSGVFVMIPLADAVHMVGDYISPATEKMIPLMSALFDCGVRFLEFLERLGGEDDETLHYLKPWADKAQKIRDKGDASL